MQMRVPEPFKDGCSCCSLLSPVATALPLVADVGAAVSEDVLVLLLNAGCWWPCCAAIDVVAAAAERLLGSTGATKLLDPCITESHADSPTQ